MRRPGRGFGERGSAAVELALLLPLLIAAVFWAVYFTELSVLRIRQQEASRFLAWETSTGLADLGAGRHAARFFAVAGRAVERTQARYANLESHELSSRPSTWLARPRLGALEARPVALAETRSEELGRQVLDRSASQVRGDGAMIPSLSSLVRGLENRLVGWLRGVGLATDAIGVSAAVGLEVENRWMEGDDSVFPAAVRRISLAPATAHLESETWALEDGGDVGPRDRHHPFARQVSRMAFFGVGDRLEGALRQLDLRELVSFPSAHVISQRYGSPGLDSSRLDCRGEPLSATGKWRNGPTVGTREDGMSPAKCFDTLPMEAAGLGGGYGEDPVYRQLRARGEGYLGREIGAEVRHE